MGRRGPLTSVYPPATWWVPPVPSWSERWHALRFPKVWGWYKFKCHATIPEVLLGEFSAQLGGSEIHQRP